MSKWMIVGVMLFASSVQAAEVDDLVNDIIDAHLSARYCMLTNKDLVSEEVLQSSSTLYQYLQESVRWGWGQTPDRYVGRAATFWAANTQTDMSLAERCNNILRYGIHSQAKSIENKVNELKKKGSI